MSSSSHALTIEPSLVHLRSETPEGAWRAHWSRHVARDAATLAGAVCDLAAILFVLLILTGAWSRDRAAQLPVPSGAGLAWPQASLLAALLLVGGFALRGTYSREMLLRTDAFLKKAGAAWLAWSALVLGCGGSMRLAFPFTLVHAALLCGLAGAAVVCFRCILNRLLALEPIAARVRERVLFIGWTEEAGRLAGELWGNPREEYEVAGFVELPSGAYQFAPCANVPCLGDVTHLVELFQHERISQAFLTDLNIPSRTIGEIASICEREYVDFKIIPSYFPILVSGLHVNHIGGSALLGLDRLPLHRLRCRLWKRGLDIVGALAGLVLSLPLVLLFGAIVYLESPGPIFYRQRRIGRNGRPFSMVKIRSMRTDAEKDGRVGWTTKDDPRRLRIGAFMRQWNIDEIPQFWNVLCGDMSLVGPRPERPELIRDFKHDIAHYNARHSIKPGVTGWAQVNGLRGDTDLTERIRFDIYYIEHWNPLLDLQIMIFTFFKRTNAC